ncbi:hypothetical protein C9J48_04175 [Photobacterium profundum]|uniref:Uncharacterized protein n=2 Tax=Photobacterium profundum TaxID=74109 RepID=Q1Z7I0_9GAMM|nr:hypothetical protein P3TCK_15020 [Photobacterium profundum 3TCK]PSV64657.1 hypothetical protein C9J48_04175 [Photobacterium profundum]
MTFQMKEPKQIKEEAKKKPMTQKELIQQLEKDIAAERKQTAEHAEQLAALSKYTKPLIEAEKAKEEQARRDNEAAKAKAKAERGAAALEAANYHCNTTNVFTTDQERRAYGMAFISENYPDVDPASYPLYPVDLTQEIERGLDVLKRGMNAPLGHKDSAYLFSNYMRGFVFTPQIAAGISRAALALEKQLACNVECLDLELAQIIERDSEKAAEEAERRERVLKDTAKQEQILKKIVSSNATSAMEIDTQNQVNQMIQEQDVKYK